MSMTSIEFQKTAKQVCDHLPKKTGNAKCIIKQCDYIFVVILFSCSILMACAFVGANDDTSREIDAKKPITVAASCIGRFSRGHSWYLSLNSAGQAELTITSGSRAKRSKFDLTKESITNFIKLIEKNKFFDLRDEYGRQVPDSSQETITIVRGGQAKTVRLNYLADLHDKAAVREVGRAIRVSMAIRDWFDDKEAVDLRAHRKRILDELGD